MSVLYVIVYPLSDMNGGKAQAHSGHAAGAFTYATFKADKMSGAIKIAANQWLDSTTQGFGTQINLQAPSVDAVDMLTYKLNKVKDPSLYFDTIHDPTYPYVVDSTIMPLIDKKIHTLPPQLLPDGNYRCFRAQDTALYVFDMSEDRAFRKYCDFELHP